MLNLLNAGFTRLRKHKLLWILITFTIVLALFMIYTKYRDMDLYNEHIEVEQIMFNYSTIVGVVISIFTSLFLGVEYSDGIIRNKINIGHKRLNIYLSNLIIVTITSLFSYIIFLLVVASVGIPLFGSFTMKISSFLKIIGCILVTTMAYSSIFTFFAMMISNKTITAVVSIMFAFGLMMASLICLNILTRQEFIQSGSLVDGEMKFEEVPNPKYPSEKEKEICQVLLDINPAGQMFELVGRIAPNLKVLPIYSLSIIIITTGTGILLFKKKELK